uniref:Minichromosome maintenance domain-containing protein 2 n=1 Tax=Oryzias melastigma TaxID=30732 RepID=A0A3B3D9B3_ORYME
MADVLSFKESIVVYLDRSGGFKKLEDDCRPLNPQRTEAVYKFCIRVNPSDVMEIDPLLGDLVLHNPLKATYLFQTVCFLAIKTLSLTEKICTESQVNVTLNFTHLPPFPEYMLDLCKFPRVYGPMRPVCMEGFVIAMTRVTKYTQGARFLCVNDDCPCSTFHHIRVHTPGATESATVRNDFTCMVCSSQLKEDMKFRVLGELCNSMRIGQLYSVLGIPALVHQWPNITWNVEANNVQQSEPKCSKLPTKFRELLNGTASSAWRFSAIAAHCFGLEVAPPGLYNTVKFILLLSLVQTNTSINYTFQYLNVLVVTSETLIMDLMAHSLRLAFRGVRHQASGEMFASLSRDEHGAGAANIHAGSALLATGGICMLGDISCYKKDKLDHIQSLESHTASVFIPGKKFGEDADQMLSLPVQCSFWALTESSQRSGKLDSAVLGTAQEMGPVPLQFSEAFGLIIECKERVGQQAQLAQTLHTLQQAVHPGLLNYPLRWEFSTQDYAELVSCARDLQVELLPAAKALIHGYYMASRRARTQSHGVKISAASIKLISLAEAHCKLCLRTEVLEEDAVIAVLLCENAVTLKHASTLFLPPEPVFPCDVGEADGLHKRDIMLDELHQNILRFIYTYAPGADTYITEE